MRQHDPHNQKHSHMITTLAQATPAWFTAVLRTNGVLEHGAIVAVDQRTNAAFNSTVAHCAVQYDGAPAHVPHSLLLKLNHDHAGANEITLYTLIASEQMTLPMLPPCYAAVYDHHSGDSYCLLADVSATHAPPVKREQLLNGNGVPADAQLDQVIDALAHFHAAWWNHPLLGTDSNLLQVRPWFRDAQHFARHRERREREWVQFQSTVGAWFPADLHTLYATTLARLPRLWERVLAQRITTLQHITLAHGDCYLTQFLCARNGRDAAYLIDFGDTTANFGAFDLVYLMATFWTTAQRHAEQREDRLLRRYYATLQTHGIMGYSYADLLLDYRAMLALMIFDPVWNQTGGSSPRYWWPKMQCLVAAFRDWNCAELVR